MKKFCFILFALIVAIMCWESQLAAANVADSGPVPEKSIRLRIIANSDSFQDQWLKREVRDAIIARMNEWVTDIGSLDEARAKVSSQLPELQALVDKTIRERGFTYQATVDFGMVPFPTKMYGSYVYPAGEYEALRVRIGEAKGQNWWCVLFPPLCFIDLSNGVAAGQPEENSRHASEEKQGYRVANGEEKETETSSASPASTDDGSETEQPTENTAPKVEVRFFLWDKLIALFT